MSSDTTEKMADADTFTHTSIDAGLSNLVTVAFGNSVSKGFWDGKNKISDIPEKIALIHSEASEALEELRESKFEPEEAMFDLRKLDSGKPVGFASEIADIVIRCADLCGGYGIDLGEAVVEKLKYNSTREKMHGKKF
jgi:NTP pyrophosphatase (non-canonical NTP hydrolase)